MQLFSGKLKNSIIKQYRSKYFNA